jgi:site-specific recombinase XerD
MVVKVLTDHLVQELSCPSGRKHLEVFDTEVKGFYLDLLCSGRKSYRVRYWLDGKKRLESIGDAKLMTVHQARTMALQAIQSGKLWPAGLVQVQNTSKCNSDRLISLEAFLVSQYVPYVRSYKRSWQSDECMIRVHIVPALGKMAMAKLSALDVSGFIETLKHKQLAPGTINRALVLLRYAYKLAHRWSVPGVSLDSFNGVRYLKNDNRIERYLTAEQSSLLLEAVRGSHNRLLHMIVAYLIYTGARKREVLDAKWTDIDWAQRSWKISKNKSNKIRHIPLSLGALDILTQAKTHQLITVSSDYIFPNPYTLKPFVSFFFSWDAARKRAGLLDLLVHDLRHSFASFLVNAGRSLYEVQELLGHTDIKTTSRYAHLSRERLIAAVECVPRL